MRLQDALWNVVREYTRQMCELMDVKEAHWVGTDDHSGIARVCHIGGLNMTLGDMQTVIDDMDGWVRLHGSRDEVKKKVLSWKKEEGNLNKWMAWKR